MVQLIIVCHVNTKFGLFSISSQLSVAIPRAFVEIIQTHFEDALGDGHTRRFLHRFGIVLEKEQRKRKSRGGGNQSPGNGFGQVADAGFFRIGHGRILYL